MLFSHFLQEDFLEKIPFLVISVRFGIMEKKNEKEGCRMLKIDLITGFLGAGKTTFLKKYAKYFMEKGQNIGILENDFGAVNVDMMLLQDLMGEQCEIEMIAGGCDKETHRRRFRTKLIAMRMCGYDRILVEPSGVFDVDEFFDILRDEPLDQWYEIGNVIAVVPANLEHELSESADYILASEVANAGKILFSHADETEKSRIEETLTHLNHALEQIHCGRKIEMGDVWCGNLEEPGAMDLDVISQCGYELESYEKMDLEKHQGFESVYLMDMHFSEKDLKEFVDKIMKNTKCGEIFRVKGFFQEEGEWRELNATKSGMNIKQIGEGQDVIIIIGSGLSEEKIREEL